MGRDITDEQYLYFNGRHIYYQKGEKRMKEGPYKSELLGRYLLTPDNDLVVNEITWREGDDPYIDIREYWRNQPTKRGMHLQVKQLANLMNLIDEILVRAWFQNAEMEKENQRDREVEA